MQPYCNIFISRKRDFSWQQSAMGSQISRYTLFSSKRKRLKAQPLGGFKHNTTKVFQGLCIFFSLQLSIFVSQMNCGSSHVCKTG